MSDPNIEPLIDFIVKRDRIARLKAAGKPQPWTDDPHLATKRFTEINVSHDRISRFIYETITRPYADHPNLIGALVFSRLSNEPTVISAALPALFPLNADQLLAIMTDRYERGLRMERDAYLIPALGPGKPKVKNHIEQLLVPLAQSGERLRAGDTVEGVFQRLRQFPILKKGFINAQVVRDAKSVAPLRSASDWETFVWSGPGSRQCTDLLHGYSVEEAITREKKRSSTWDDEDELKWRAKFRTIVNLAKPRVAEIEIEDCQSWQSCLCETAKLIKYRAGHLDGARKYVPYGSPTPQSHEREAKPKPAPIAPPAVPAKPIAPPRPYPRGLFVSLAAPFITPATTKSDGLRRLAFDIETDGLDDATKVHCVVIADLDGDQIDEYGPDQIDAALAHLNRADCLIGHNIAGYDLPLLRRLHSWTPAPKCAVADTLIAARLILPHLDDIDAEVKARAGASLGKLHGRYSLEAFGVRLGIPKIGANIEAWSTWTPEVQARCVGDVVITKALWWFLQPDGYSQQALELEHRVAAVCARITADGMPFDVDAAERLRRQWEARRAELEAQLRQQFKIKNLNSRLQIARLLEARGWKPEKRTEKTGQPVIDDELLETLPEQYPEFTGLAEHYIIGRRLGQLEEGKQAWLSNVGPDGRIHGGLVHVGTPHSRAKHLKPNLAQVPNPKRGKPLATECRALFRASNGWVFVTCDQSNLQDRGFAHYLAWFDGGAYAKAFLDGADTHWSSAIALGLVPAGTERDKASKVHTAIREGAKRWRYGFLYGTGALRAGQILAEIVRDVRRIDPTSELHRQFFGSDAHPSDGALQRVGGEARRKFMAATPGLQRLRQSLDVQHTQQEWVEGLDGRRVPTGAKYKSLNRAVTAAEAVLCKRWLVNVADELRERFDYGWGGDVVIVAWVHDELVVCCRPEIAKQVGELMVRYARESGEFYSFKVPLDAEYKIGRSWAGESAPTSAIVDTIVTDANDRNDDEHALDDSRADGPGIDPGAAATVENPEVSADVPLAVLLDGDDGEPRDEGGQAGLAAAGIDAEATAPPGAEPAAEVTALAAALDYAARGWPVLPVPPGTKKSYRSAEHNGGARWGATLNPEEIRRDWVRWPDAGVGIVAGAASGVWVLEADTLAAHGVDGLASVVALEAKHGKLPDTLMVESPRGSLHRWFKHSRDGIKIKCSASAVAPGVDVIGDGGMIMAPPSVRPGVGVYRWVSDLPIAEAPAWLLELVKEQPHEQGGAEPEAAIEQVVMALAEIPNSDIGWTAWNHIGMATWRATGGSEEGYEAFAQWSAKSNKHNAEIARERWEHYVESPPTSVGAGTLFFLAKGEWQRDPRFATADPENAHADAEETDPLAGFHFDGAVPIAPEPTLIDGLLSTTGLTLIGGQSSAGKTFLAIAMAVCLAEKKPFFGREVRERVGTLYIAGEGQGAIAARFAAAKIASDIKLERRLPIAWLDAPPSLESASKIAAFIDKLRALDVKFRQEHDVRLGVVLIDTASACFDLKDENDNAEVTRICKIMQRVGAGFGGVTVPVHHYGKVLEAGPRGASAWRGHADIILGALANIDPLTGAPTDRALVVAKSRDGMQGPVAPFALEFIPLGVDQAGREFGACIVKPELEGEVQFGQAKKRKAARSETALREAIDAALYENGVTKTFQGRHVRASTAEQVRLEFNRRYLVTEEDPLKAARAKRVAFNRALTKLPTEFGMGEFEGMQWLWQV